MDAVRPAQEGIITLGDLKRCSQPQIMLDMFLNVHRFMAHTSLSQWGSYLRRQSLARSNRERERERRRRTVNDENFVNTLSSETERNADSPSSSPTSPNEACDKDASDASIHGKPHTEATRLVIPSIPMPYNLGTEGMR